MTTILTSTVLTSSLAAIPLFAGWSTDELAALAHRVHTMTAAPGEILVHEASYGDRMYLIRKGSVQIYTTAVDGTDLVLTRFDAGKWFGEQALLPESHGRRNSSARALEVCELVVITRDALREALNQHPDLLRRFTETGDAQRAMRNSRLGQEAFASLGLAGPESAYDIQQWEPGQVIIREGDPGDRVYLVLRGRVQVSRRQEGQDVILSHLLAGQFFGELAILHDAPRAATVEAVDETETVGLDATWFRAAHRDVPQLRSLMEALSQMYLLPQRGLVTLQSGTLDGRPSVTAVHHLPDGRRAVSTRLIAASAFTSRIVGAGEEVTTIRYESAERAQLRELMLMDDLLVGVHAEGEWASLGEILRLMLDGTRVDEWQIALFHERGDFRVEEFKPLYEEREEICACTHTTCGQIQQAIRDGCHTLSMVASRTRASLVCGGCAPLVKELLGQADWTPARIVETVSLTDDIRAFRIQTIEGHSCQTHLPGQHLVLQARIDNRWVQRSYTLSSVSGQGPYEITVKREVRGLFSRWLFDRMTSDSLLRVSAPGGDYVLTSYQTRDVVCMVAGIGVTPALAFLRSAAHAPQSHGIHVDYSVSNSEQAFCWPELEAFSSPAARISSHLRVTSTDGRIGHRTIEDLVSRFPDADYYLCGGASYLASVQDILEQCGVAPERVRIEFFTAAGERVQQSHSHSHPAEPVAVTHRPSGPMESARHLLEAFYTEAGASTAFAARWTQVEGELESSGTWRQTTEELTYAARIAWRNSVRCIGRMYWGGLAVRDFRHASTADEMFEAIFDHIEFATNGGNLRPVITVFAAEDEDGQSPRVWSSQLFRYAGYRQPDGTVFGDPANLEMTEVAGVFGWTPAEPRGPFDLLPLIVQAVGEPPQWRTIPERLVMEVPIVHPEFSWFGELGLRWYALPAVSSMLFDGAGVRYPAAPFNGWYMGTEIGARNFGDVKRYNMLPVVARRMGLDISNDRSLWRDRALVELNIAVLHSYDRAGVTMMDHHSASNSFDRFETIECQAKRRVHADWKWLVPPISGSACTVFHHQGHWPEDELKPNYFAQLDAWKRDT